MRLDLTGFSGPIANDIVRGAWGLACCHPIGPHLQIVRHLVREVLRDTAPSQHLPFPASGHLRACAGAHPKRQSDTARYGLGSRVQFFGLPRISGKISVRGKASLSRHPVGHPEYSRKDRFRRLPGHPLLVRPQGRLPRITTSPDSQSPGAANLRACKSRSGSTLDALLLARRNADFHPRFVLPGRNVRPA